MEKPRSGDIVLLAKGHGKIQEYTVVNEGKSIEIG